MQTCTRRRASRNRKNSSSKVALKVLLNRLAQPEKNSNIKYLLKNRKGCGRLTHTLLRGDQRAAPLAFLKNRKPKDRMDAPTNSVRTGLAVTMSQTMPMPETMTVPASVSRLAAVTAVSGITSFTNLHGLIGTRLSAGCGSRIRTDNLRADNPVT